MSYLIAFGLLLCFPAVGQRLMIYGKATEKARTDEDKVAYAAATLGMFFAMFSLFVAMVWVVQ